LLQPAEEVVDLPGFVGRGDHRHRAESDERKREKLEG
jgi:hypothetical protein